jgi:serine/threonine protein phosphatase PrpC
VRLDYAAVSDVGRVRRDNQDSGYAGAYLLVVCDGVGGAARGDIASATAISTLRALDKAHDVDPEQALAEVRAAMDDAHEKLAQLVDEDPGLAGTSTTATLVRFDGDRITVGHAGDSRAYLFRGGALQRLTTDHTFVQGLIDEGRITEDEARVHPHRNLILKAIDGRHEVDPDLFHVEIEAGDRLFLCSDGACGVLEDGRMADILSTGSADFAATELVRASLEAGSSDNVTCVVADVRADGDELVHDEPLVVGSAAELRRRGRGLINPVTAASLFRGHRAGDTGELEPIDAEILNEAPFAVRSDPDADPESARYAPQAPGRFMWASRLFAVVVVAGLIWAAMGAAWSWVQEQYYVGESDGMVVIYRGVDASLPGVDLSSPYETTNVEVDRLSSFDARQVNAGIDARSLAEARATVESLAAKMEPAP